MTGVRTRTAGVVLTAAACAAVLSTTSTFTSGLRTLMAEVGLVDNFGFIMGGTGNPIPDSNYLSSVENLYLNQLPLTYDYKPLETPEQFCPIECSSPGQLPLTFGQSVNTGVTDLHGAADQLLGNPLNNISVLGYSQSATVASQWMNELIANNQSNLNDLHVTLLGDPNSAIGGILDRFQFPDGVGAFSLSPEPQHVPFLDIPLSLDPTPTSGIATDIFTGEYDGWANFPLDPSNLWADLNALIGIETVHPYYPDPDPGVNLDTTNMIDLGTIGNSNFWAIPAPLPALAFLYDGGPAGHFFYDAFSPFATLIDDWGYGNPGDPGAGIPVEGPGGVMIDPIGVAGPWQVDATGQLMASGVDGFIPKMDPLQMLAGVEHAATQTILGPINDLLQDFGRPELPGTFLDVVSGYDFTNHLDASLLTAWMDLTASLPNLAPDAILDGSPLISGQPLIDLVGYGFDIFNFFGA
ncbi:PE-PPE domain-containing protein [Mycobacterium sp.]|uniref:PE-PPE domain-containing protein n=1 Tax=Mycobacterium sp. TaxID=1785 RepID=UPI003BAF6285